MAMTRQEAEALNKEIEQENRAIAKYEKLLEIIDSDIGSADRKFIENCVRKVYGEYGVYLPLLLTNRINSAYDFRVPPSDPALALLFYIGKLEEKRRRSFI